jgi:chromatin remodeling complex protein RSC6
MPPRKTTTPESTTKAAVPSAVEQAKAEPSTTAVEETASSDAAPADVSTRLADALDKSVQIAAAGKDLVSMFKQLQKDVAKLTKGRKQPSKSADPKEPKKLSGFAKPTDLSDKLCEFLSLPTGSMLARTDVTRLINKYIKDNNLQNPEDRRSIAPDAKLSELLGLQPGEQLTYFKLQSHLKPQFEKGAIA